MSNERFVFADNVETSFLKVFFTIHVILGIKAVKSLRNPCEIVEKKLSLAFFTGFSQ